MKVLKGRKGELIPLEGVLVISQSGLNVVALFHNGLKGLIFEGEKEEDAENFMKRLEGKLEVIDVSQG